MKSVSSIVCARGCVIGTECEFEVDVETEAKEQNTVLAALRFTVQREFISAKSMYLEASERPWSQCSSFMGQMHVMSQ